MGWVGGGGGINSIGWMAGAQAKAIWSATENDAFTLIQGPPGSGKTKTIVAMVGAILSPTLGGGDDKRVDRWG